MRDFVPFLAAFGLLIVGPNALAQDLAEPLRRIEDVRNLPRPVAARELRIKLRCVVTYDTPTRYGPLVVEEGGTGIFLQLGNPNDATTTTSSDIPPELEHMPEGTVLEIEGITGTGDYAPVIRGTRVRATGETFALSPPQRTSVAELQTGRFDCQRVEVEGVIRSAVFNQRSNQIDFDLMTELGSLVIHLESAKELDFAAMVDARVRVRGACLMYFNRRNEEVGVHLQLGSLKNVTLMTAAPPNPFGVPLLEFNRLRPFSPEPRNLHRRRISGTVTYIEPKSFIILQNGERAVRINLRQHPPLQIGDRVEAAGFVELREFYAELGDALVRKTGRGDPIRPEPVDALRVMGPPNTPAQRLPEDFDGRLVMISGNVVAIDERQDSRHLLMETNSGIVEAILPGATDPPLPGGVRSGSSIRVTGVCMVTYTEKVPVRAFPRPRTFEIRLRTPKDIYVLSAAPWWTPRRLWIALAIVGGGALLCVAWVGTLRRRVTQRARELAEEIEARQNAEVEFEATLRERKRLAADLHDTLEQSLTGLARQLEAADELRLAQPERSGSHLGLARQLLDRSQEDVRRSVWNLHSASLEELSLAEALHELVEYRSADQPVNLLVEVQGSERPLPDFVSGNLLLLAQEGITNAFKHAEARTVILRLCFKPESLDLSISDDGRGFVVSDALGPQEGHFGVQGMRERVKRMGGKLTVVSTPGNGTTVTAHLRG